MAHVSNWYQPGRKSVLGKDAYLDIADAKPLVDGESVPFALGFRSDAGRLMIVYLDNDEVRKLYEGSKSYLEEMGEEMNGR